MVAAVAEVARDLSKSQVNEVVDILDAYALDPSHDLRGSLTRVLPASSQFLSLSRLLALCNNSSAALAPGMLASMLLVAQRAAEETRAEQSVELVWTGPEIIHVPLRRTEQVLLELIQSASESLLLVSFAVYMVSSVSDALTRAARRGVRVDICVESPEPGNVSVGYDTVAALGADVRQAANVYVWPLSKRRRAANGAVAALHAKCAVADAKKLLVSSANLTEYALSLNLEMGVLITGGHQPATVARAFERLIAEGTFVRLTG